MAYDGRKPWEYGDGELQTLCWYCHGRLKGIRPGSVQVGLDEWSYDGDCPWCGGDDLKDKGVSGDRCLRCGRRIEFWLFVEAEGKTESELKKQLAVLA